MARRVLGRHADSHCRVPDCPSSPAGSTIAASPSTPPAASPASMATPMRRTLSRMQTLTWSTRKPAASLRDSLRPTSARSNMTTFCPTSAPSMTSRRASASSAIMRRDFRFPAPTICTTPSSSRTLRNRRAKAGDDRQLRPRRPIPLQQDPGAAWGLEDQLQESYRFRVRSRVGSGRVPQPRSGR